MENVYFVGSKREEFLIRRLARNPSMGSLSSQHTLSFNKIDVTLARGKATEFPGSEYDQDPTLPFSISFVSPRTIRLRMSTRVPMRTATSLMLAGQCQPTTHGKSNSTIRQSATRAHLVTYASSNNRGTSSSTSSRVACSLVHKTLAIRRLTSLQFPFRSSAAQVI